MTVTQLEMTKEDMATDLGAVSYVAAGSVADFAGGALISDDKLSRDEWVDHFMTFSHTQLTAEMRSYGLL